MRDKGKPSKRHRFGVKLYEICDVETGHILGFIVYTGSRTELSTEMETLGKSGQIVDTLMDKYYNKNHVLYIENWYTSPRLVQHLFDRDTGACGTAKGNRKGMPVFGKKLNKGECETAARTGQKIKNQKVL